MKTPRKTLTTRFGIILCFLVLFAPSAWMIATVPPLWRDIDAYVQVTQDPRVATFWGHGPAYCYLSKVPIFVGAQLERFRSHEPATAAPQQVQTSLTDTGVWLLIVSQHLALDGAVFYFILAISSLFWVRFALVLAWASNPLSYTFAHCVGSETLSMILLIILVLKALHLVRSERDPRWWEWHIFAILLTLCILTRHLNLCLVALLPSTFFLMWLHRRLAGFFQTESTRKLWRQRLPAKYFSRALIALAIGIGSIAISQSLTRDLARKTRFHPHSTMGCAFMWRLNFLQTLSPEARTALLAKVSARSRTPETRQLLGVLEQIEKEGLDPVSEQFRKNAIALLFSQERFVPWEKFDGLLNDIALAFLLPPTREHLRAASSDFAAALAAPVSDVSNYLFGATTYYFNHRDEMPGCAYLVTFRDRAGEQITFIPTNHAYFRLWKGASFACALATWAIAWISLLLLARRKKENLSAILIFGFVVTSVGLTIVAATCLLDEYSPRFGLPMWELLLLSLFLLLGTITDLLLSRRQSKAATGKRSPPGS